METEFSCASVAEFWCDCTTLLAVYYLFNWLFVLHDIMLGPTVADKHKGAFIPDPGPRGSVRIASGATHQSPLSRRRTAPCRAVLCPAVPDPVWNNLKTTTMYDIYTSYKEAFSTLAPHPRCRGAYIVLRWSCLFVRLFIYTGWHMKLAKF